MSAPVKPWESSVLRNTQYSSSLGNMPPNVLHRLTGRSVFPGNQQVPPLPPRHNTRNSYFGYNSNPMFNSGQFGMYGYGMPYNGGFGMRGDYDSRFLLAAEEATSNTFQSIESFVRTFSSITMMLESTYQALHLSFRSVLSVADNMSKLRSVAINVFSSLSILKFLYWLYRRILYLLGLVNSAPIRESAWLAAQTQVTEGSEGILKPALSQPSSTWPLLSLFGLMLGAPYLLYRVLAPQINSNTPEGWDSSNGIMVKAVCNFDNPQKGEIPFKKGDILVVPSDFRVHHGWTIAKLKNNVGYIPADRVTIYFGQDKAPTEKLKPEGADILSEEVGQC